MSVPIAWTAITFLVFGTVLSMFPVGGPDPDKESMNYTVVITTAVWGGSLLYYYVDARKWFTGPKITIDAEDLSEEQVTAIREEGIHVEGFEDAKMRVVDTKEVSA